MNGNVKPGYTRTLDLKHGCIEMSHGAGGRAMTQLIQKLFLLQMVQHCEQDTCLLEPLHQ